MINIEKILHSGGIEMIRCKVLIGIATAIIIMTAGCGGGSDSTPSPISSETLHEVRVGNAVLDPAKPNLIPLSKTNTMRFQFLKEFNPSTYEDSLRLLVNIYDASNSWAYTFSTADLANNGTLALENNQYGGVVTFSAFRTFDYLNYITWDEKKKIPVLMSGSFVNPGDKIWLNVGFIKAEFEDESDMFLRKDNILVYYTRDVIERPVALDDIDTGGFIESVKFGEFVITDKDINILPLSQIFEITVDFNTQLNLYKFEDLLDFRIILNNLFQKTSYIIDRSNMSENGVLYVVDYVNGLVKYQLFNPMTTVKLNGVTQTPAQPGDVIEVKIDFLSGEDIYQESFGWEDKKFRVFYASNELGG